MRMYLKIAFGVSSTFCKSSTLPFQGSIQGNSIAPVLWLIISIILIRFLCAKGIVDLLKSPISHTYFSLIMLLCTDNTNLNLLNLEGKSTIEMVHKA